MAFSFQHRAKTAACMHKAGFDRARRDIEGDSDFGNAEVLKMKQSHRRALGRGQ